MIPVTKNITAEAVVDLLNVLSQFDSKRRDRINDVAEQKCEANNEASNDKGRKVLFDKEIVEEEDEDIAIISHKKPPNKNIKQTNLQTGKDNESEEKKDENEGMKAIDQKGRLRTTISNPLDTQIVEGMNKPRNVTGPNRAERAQHRAMREMAALAGSLETDERHLAGWLHCTHLCSKVHGQVTPALGRVEQVRLGVLPLEKRSHRVMSSRRAHQLWKGEDGQEQLRTPSMASRESSTGLQTPSSGHSLQNTYRT
jgi:hypothetical protein